MKEMYYSIEEAKKYVIEAGHRLLENGLVARTWGNISARISADEFVITPSGRGYEDLTPEDLVVVKVADASYTGNIKPSSEKILHAACYRLRPETGFIIHTHQFYASAISVSGKDFSFAPNAAYGLPGTKKLAKTVSAAVAAHPGDKSFLMQRHGAVVLGADFDEAFRLAEELEENSRAVFDAAVPSVASSEKLFEGVGPQTRCFYLCRDLFGEIPAYLDDFAQLLGRSVNGKNGMENICTGEDAEAERMILEKNCASLLYGSTCKAKPMGALDAGLQRYIYLKKYSKLKETNRE